MQALSMRLADWLARESADEVLDVVVIGSGYGGSVAALRLAQAGRHVTLLERGSEFLPGDFPNDVGQLPKFLRAQGPVKPMGSLCGLFDWHVGPGVASLVANGLGGGSLINAGVMMRPDAEVFAQQAWPAAIRCDLDRAEDSIDTAFDKAGGMLQGEVFHDRGRAPGSESALPKAQALHRLAHRLASDSPLGAHVAQAYPATVTIDLDKCTRCGDCFTGCNVEGAKRTLHSTYLQQAHAAGAQIVTGATVRSIAPADGDRWEIVVLPTERCNDGRRVADAADLHGRTLTACVLVLAAGTFGSTELLLRSQALAGERFTLSPALGTRFSGNGDKLSVLADCEQPVHGVGIGADQPRAAADAPVPADHGVGPTITTVLDMRHRHRHDGDGDNGSDTGDTGPLALSDRIVIEDGAVPGALARVYEETLATSWLLRHLGDHWRNPRQPGRGADPIGASPEMAEHAQMLLTMGHDGAKGRIVWVPGMDAAAPYWVRPEDEETHIRQQAVFDAAERVTDSVHLHTPLWRMLPPATSELAEGPKTDATMLTVHPLGGCPMGDTFDSGVVNHLGQVWRSPQRLWPNLMVLDGSIVPTSLGCNPLWTITALAERAVPRWRKLPPVERPAKARPVSAPARAPSALTRDAPVHFNVVARERLEQRHLPLRGELRQALGPTVESDLVVRMRHADWLTLWRDAQHRLDRIRGELRMVDRAHPERRLEYRIQCGTVDLLSYEAPWPVVGNLMRALRCIRVGLSWWILRGARDWRERVRRAEPLHMNLATLRGIFCIAWQAAEVRHVIYDLWLKRTNPPASDKGGAPRKLKLRGVKHVGYAASWSQLLHYGWMRLRQHGWDDDHPGKWHPRDLRESLVQQLTRPTLTIAPKGSWMTLLPARWPAWLDPRTRARFDFDQQQALAHSPLTLLGRADSSAAMLALGAYPALLARHALLTHLLEFRLPSYSGSPMVDPTAEDVRLELGPRGRPTAIVTPDEIELMVRRGRSSSDDGAEQAECMQLRLWRYRRPAPDKPDPDKPITPDFSRGTWCGRPVRRARSVLLMHAFGMSGQAFTLKTTERSFAEHLYEQGFEVWILDSRMSPRTKASGEPATLDQVGQIDVPAAVDHIIEKLNEEFRAGPDESPLQIYAFGQCLGAAALQMALLTGRLSHPVQADERFRTATQILPQMPKLAGLVSSQTHMFIVGSRSSQSKTWVPSFLRNLAGRALVPLAVRGAFEGLIETAADRFFAASPVPAEERCPAEGETDRAHDDDCATCRRIRFIDAELFKHRHLNGKTHRALPQLFGDANVRMFAHGARFVEYERLVSEDGSNVYVTNDAIGRYLALPIRFVHGAENQLFDVESARRSAQQYARVHPQWVEAFGIADPASGGTRAVCDVIDGYGHLDVLIGQTAMQAAGAKGSPYERLSGLLADAWARADAPQRSNDAQADALADASAPPIVIRFPHAGPWLGPIVNQGGRHTVRLAFVMKDCASEATRPGAPSASALLRNAAGERVLPLQVWEFPVPLPARDGFGSARDAPPSADADDRRLIGWRVAWGEIALSDADMAGDLHIECVSHAYAPGPVHEAMPRDRGMPATPEAAAAHGPLPQLSARKPLARPQPGRMRDAPLSAEMLHRAIDAAIADAKRERRDAQRPFPLTLSMRRKNASNGDRRFVTLPRHAMAARGPDEGLTVALGCCRYPGLPFDRERTDDVFGELDRAVHALGDHGPDLLLLLGDQIYADATAGLVDPLSAMERYPRRHQDAFTTPKLRALLSHLPVVSVVDDHEFADAYPLAAPLFRGDRDGRLYAGAREERARDCAMQALLAYQMMHMPASTWQEGYCSFQRGGVRFFVADTRCWRKRLPDGSVSVLPPRVKLAFRRWLAADDRSSLHCVVTGSVIAPGSLPGSDPADVGPPDSLQASPAERAWLLSRLVRRVPRRFVLVSGDYHLSFAGRVLQDGETVGAAIVAPPFYAPLPYANSTPEDVWLGERIALPGGRTLSVEAVDGMPPQRGSGFGLLRFERVRRGWCVTLETQLTDFERGTHRPLSPWPTICLDEAIEEALPRAA
jgi:choline dehydrogenase-like flavoprotein